MVKSILFALVLTLINALSFWIIVKIAINKDWKSFNKLVFGSMVFRYFLTAGVVWVCLVNLELDKLAFSLTFLVSTFFLLMGEIILIHKRQKINND